MISRVWRAAASTEGANAYREHFSRRVLPHLERIAGFSGVRLLERELDGEVEVLVMTLWQSPDAVRAFAGTDIETAVVEPEARAVLSRYDTVASHYAVVIDAERDGREELRP